VDVLWGIAIFLAGLAAGGALNNAVAMVPALRRLPAEHQAEVRAVTNTLADPALAALSALAGLAGLALLVFEDVTKGVLVAALILTGAAVAALAAATRASDRRWDLLQLAAAAAAVGALACFAIAAADHPLSVLVTVFAGLVAGGLLVVEIGLVRAVAAVPDAVGIRLHVSFDHYVEWTMPELTVATILLAVAELITNGDLPTGAVVLTIAGVLGEAAVAAVSQFVNFPINGAMRSWEPGAVPRENAALRRRWNRAHRTRTGAGQIAFICLVIAFLATY
jgi:hypothetical protein